MIISHKYKFIFLHAPKTAGGSLSIALSKFCGPRDIITPLSDQNEKYRRELGYRGKQNYYINWNRYSTREKIKAILSWKKLPYAMHFTALQLKRKISPEIWTSYFKFCFDRNPFDKFISYYYWHSHKEEYDGFKEYLMTKGPKWLSAYEFYSVRSIPALDKIYKYEEMEDALEDISQRLNFPEKLELPPVKIHSITRKDRRHYREVLSEFEVKWISTICAREMVFLGYEY